MKNVMPKGQTSKRQTFVCKAGEKTQQLVFDNRAVYDDMSDMFYAFYPPTIYTIQMLAKYEAKLHAFPIAQW